MRIRRLVDEVDERQRDGAGLVDGPATTAPAGPDSPSLASRRNFVRTLGLGAAAFGAVAVSGVALAQGASAATSTDEAPTLSDADRQIVRFLQSIELAGVAGYTAAIEGGKLGTQTVETARTFQQYHREHAQAFGALLQSSFAVTTPNQGVTQPLVAAVNGAATETAVIVALYEFEERASATLLRSVGLADSWLVTGPIATILPIDSMQAVVLGQLAELPETQWLPAFGTVSGAFEPASLPVS